MVNPVNIAVQKDNPLVSVIIPSLDGYRNGNVPKLMDDIKGQTVQDIEVLIVKGVTPNGHARNVGVKEARGNYLVCIDDDVRLGHNKVIENLIAPFIHQSAIRNSQSSVGLTGASQPVPPGSNYFQQLIARQLPRYYFPVVVKITDTDMVSHMCLSIPTQLYKDVGWESDVLRSGTDPDLRYRVRQAGYRVVVMPDTWAYHPLPTTLSGLLRAGYSKGKEAAWSRRHYPHLIYELGDGYESDFKPRRSFTYRIIRSFLTVCYSVVSFNLIRFIGRLSYIAGYLVETVNSNSDWNEDCRGF
ncbi:MAG: glycosyltransferase [Planctomycetes bacterium]|nr:glycosyltransferase [Planctomycetota bacterium]